MAGHDAAVFRRRSESPAGGLLCQSYEYEQWSAAQGAPADAAGPTRQLHLRCSWFLWELRRAEACELRLQMTVCAIADLTQHRPLAGGLLAKDKRRIVARGVDAMWRHGYPSLDAGLVCCI